MAAESSRAAASDFQMHKHGDQILLALERHKILFILGQTGDEILSSLVQILFQAGIYNEPKRETHDKSTANSYKYHVICVVQARRVAAIQLATKVAQDLGCQLGTTVGYAVRFREALNREETCIQFSLVGSLIRELLFDPLLSKYSVIIVDEVHERNLLTDILLSLLKCILSKRNDLKVIICSATTNIASQFIDFYKSIDGSGEQADKDLATLSIQTKSNPISILYLDKPTANYLDSAVETAINVHETSRLASGKILIFLTSKEDVDTVCDKLINYSRGSSSRLDLKKLLVLPFHGSLKPEEISQVFDEHGHNTRVCIVSTNIAEPTTINGVAFVIDCGFTRWSVFNHRTGVSALRKVPISKSLANRRAAHAGRSRHGTVFRLYPMQEFEAFEEHTQPEVQRSSLTEACLVLKSLGVNNLAKFPLLSPMPKDNLIAGLELLYLLDAIDISGALTNAGRMMARLDLDPRLSKILISRESARCTQEACKIVAMLQPKDVFVKTSKHSVDFWNNSNLSNVCASEGDMITYLNILNGFLNSQKSYKWAEKRNLNHQALQSAADIYAKLELQLRRLGLSIVSANGRVDLIQKSILSGLFTNAAYLHACDDYKTVKGDVTVYAHPTSVYSDMVEKPKLLVFLELLDTTKLFMRHIISVERQWLLDAAPSYYTFASRLENDRVRQ